MKKRILSLALSLAMLVTLGTFPAAAGEGEPTETGTTGAVTWKYYADTKTMVLQGDGATGDYTSIVADGLSGGREIVTLRVEEGVTAIGKNFCRGWALLENVTLPESLETVGERSFSDCAALKTITIPGGVTQVGRCSFMNSGALKTLVWENASANAGKYTVGDQFISGAPLTALTLPAITQFTANKTKGPFYGSSVCADGTITYAGTTAQCKTFFEGENLGIPTTKFTVTCADGKVVFENGKGTVAGEGPVTPTPTPGPVEPTPTPDPSAPTDSGTVGSSNVTWSWYEGTKTLKIGGSGDMPDYVKKAEIPYTNYLAAMETIVVEQGVTKLGDRVFYGAAATSVSIADTVTHIGEAAFRDCKALTAITIPASVTYLGRVCFYGDAALKTVIWESTAGKEYTISDQAFSGTALTALALPHLTTYAPKDAAKHELFGGCPMDLWTKGTVTYAGTVEEFKALLKQGLSGLENISSITITIQCSDGAWKQEATSADPYSGKVGDDITWRYDPEAKTLTLTGTGSTYNYPSSIPPWYNKKGDETDYQVIMTKVVVGEGITRIGDRLFINAKNLQEVHFPSTLKEITQKTFMNNTSLETLDLSGTGVEILGANLFNGATKFKTLILPNTVKSIGTGVFEKTLVEEITYRGTIAEYRALADSGNADILKTEKYLIHCNDGDYIYGQNVLGSLTYTVISGVMSLRGTGEVPAQAKWVAEAYGVHTLVLHPGLTAIGADAFKDFAALKTVYFVGDQAAWDALMGVTAAGNEPLSGAQVILALSGTCGDGVSWVLTPDEKVLTIRGSGAIDDYRSTKEVPWRYSMDAVETLVVEEGVTVLGDYAFKDMAKLTEVTLPHSLDRIGTYTFTGCYGLTELRLPEGTRLIAAKAFSDTKNLKTIHLPASLEAIDMKAFNYDTQLADVYYGGTELQWNKIRRSDSAKGNKNLLDANLHFDGEDVTAGKVYTDITGSEWYVSSLDYLLQGDYLTPSGAFDGEGGARRAELVAALYYEAGRPGMYASAEDWARRTGLTEDIPQQDLTAGQLLLMLARAAVCNGRLDGVEDEAGALAWARSLGFVTDIIADAKVTMGDAVTVLARYFQSEVSHADRRGDIIATVKAALDAGGDGKVHILAPDLTETTKGAKTGDCTLIVFPDGQTMLIDSGVNLSQEHVLNMVKDLGLKRLDYFVLTHPHIDHAGNAVAVAKYLYEEAGGSIGTYYYSGYPAPDNKTTESDIADYLGSKGVTMDRAVHAGQQWQIGGTTIDILGPTEEEVNSGNTADEFVNNVSIVMKLTYGQSTYLTGGDLYISQELVIIERAGLQLKADVIKSNHHGLYTSNSPEWLEAVDPLVMVTENDDVGSSSLMEYASQRGTAYYSAGIDGDTLVSMDSARNYEVTSQYDSILRQDYHGSIGAVGEPEEEGPRPPYPTVPGEEKPGEEKPGEEEPGGSTGFSDVSEGQWFAQAVAFAAEKKLMEGVGDGKFAPDESMTRAMMAQVLYRLAGEPEGEAPAAFTDVSEGQWYAKAVNWAAASGVLEGIGNGQFDPEGLVTREQMAVALYRLARHMALETQLRGDLSLFRDREKLSRWAEEGVSWAVAAGLIQGSDGQLLPGDGATRAEIAALLMRFVPLTEQ